MKVACPRCVSGWLAPKYGEQVCLICGHIALSEVVVVVPDIPPPERRPGGSSSARRVVAHGLVIKHYALITQYLQHGAGWETVARQLREKGSTLCKKTLVKYYQIEKNLRDCDEQKKKKTKAAAGG